MHISSQEILSKIDFPSTNSPHFSNSLFQEEQLSGKKYLVFYLMDEIFAVSARQVSEIIQLPGIAPLPNVPEWVLGIVNLRGEIISVADLLKLWNKKSSSPSSKTKLIVLRDENSNASISFITDKLGEIVTIPENAIRFNEDDSPEIFGQSSYKSNALNLLDAEKLISSLTFSE